MSNVNEPARAAAALVRVAEGRGFVIEVDRLRVIVTAAHCLSHRPPPAYGADAQARTYRNMVGPLSAAAPHIAGECLFMDLVSDLAVIGAPDSMRNPEEAAAFEALVRAGGLEMTAAADGAGWLLAADGRPFRATVRVPGPIWLLEPAAPIEADMAGTPILAADGRAFGVCVASADRRGAEAGPHPRLDKNLPAWLARPV